MATIPINISKKDRVVVIAPHPDDECIGMGGLLSLYPEICDVIVLTDGRQGKKNIAPEKVKEIRKQEFENEMKYVGVHSYRMLNYEDGTLLQHIDCLHDIDLSMYTKIFIPWGDDNHPDHAAGYLCAVKRIRQQAITEAEIYQYEVHVPFHDVSHMLDITSVIERKLELIRFHKTQVSALDYDQIAKSIGKYRACQCNLPDKYLETYLKTDVIQDSLGKEFLVREKTLQKYMQFYKLLTRWLNAKQEGKDIASYLKDKGIKSVLIYGYADIGKLLCKELLQSTIVVAGVLDKRNLSSPNSNVQIFCPSEGDRKADAVLVTAIYYFDEIEAELKRLNYKNIMSLQRIVEELEG